MLQPLHLGNDEVRRMLLQYFDAEQLQLLECFAARPPMVTTLRVNTLLMDQAQALELLRQHLQCMSQEFCAFAHPTLADVLFIPSIDANYAAAQPIATGWRACAWWWATRAGPLRAFAHA